MQLNSCSLALDIHDLYCLFYIGCCGASYVQGCPCIYGGFLHVRGKASVVAQGVTD